MTNITGLTSVYKQLIWCICFFFLTDCAFAQRKTNSKQGMQFPDAAAFQQTQLGYKIIDAPNRTWSYDIYSNGKLMIHQPNKPGMPGNEGFKTKLAAEKVAKLVISKIKRGEMPPTISEEEMKKLKVLK
jgi:hypothetical protein